MCVPSDFRNCRRSLRRGALRKSETKKACPTTSLRSKPKRRPPMLLAAALCWMGVYKPLSRQRSSSLIDHSVSLSFQKRKKTLHGFWPALLLSPKVLLEDYMCSLFGSDTQLEHMDVHCVCFGRCGGRLQGAVLLKGGGENAMFFGGVCALDCTQN
jgi:hypothetical protein